MRTRMRLAAASISRISSSSMASGAYGQSATNAGSSTDGRYRNRATLARMSRLQDRSDALWTGAVRADHTTIVSGFGPLEEVLPGLAFVESFANVTALDTGDGLVIFDTGSPMTASV